MFLILDIQEFHDKKSITIFNIIVIFAEIHHYFKISINTTKIEY